MVQEGAVPFPSHFREHPRESCIVDGESHSVPDDCERSRGCGETDLSREIRGIRRIGRSGAEVVNTGNGSPGNVEGRTGVVGAWSKEKCVVDCARLRQVEVEASRSLLAQGQRIVGNRDNPEQT